MVGSFHSDFQLPYLETFLQAAELCNFTAAAQALHLTQAAVSQRIQTLEKTLNTPLFDRSGGRVLLTKAGRKLYQLGQKIRGLHERARREIVGEMEPAPAELPLAASSIPGEHLLPSLLALFAKQQPHIRVRATIADSLAVLRLVERGEAALGLVGRKIDHPHLQYRFLTHDQLVLVVPPNHPLARRKRIAVRDLVRFPLILREEGSGLRHCFEKSLERANRSLADFSIALELSSNEAIKEAVLRGVGLAMLSKFTVEKEVERRQLRAVHLPDLECDREMYSVTDRRRVLSPPAQLFLNFLETTMVNDPGAR